MTPIQFELAAQAVSETLHNTFDFTEEERVEYVNDLCRDVVQNLIDTGLFPSNEKKLSAQDVRDMRAAHKRGTTQADLAREYSVNSATVSRIVRGIYF